jgi:Xaa-Pro aminopeptidase
MRAAGCEQALLIGPTHVVHLARYHRYGSGPCALAIRGEETTLLVPEYEFAVASAEAQADRVVGYGSPGPGLEPNLGGALADAAAVLLSAPRIALADELGGVGQAAIAKAGGAAHDIAPALRTIRMTKDADELERIADAFALCMLAQSALATAAAADPPPREIDLFAAAHSAAVERAGEPLDFLADVLAGPRSALICAPAAVPGTTTVAAPDVVVSDLAFGYRGYWGDSARTHIVGEHPEARSTRDVLATVLADAASRLLPRVSAGEVYETVSSAIAEAFPGGVFPHHLGHGVGVSVYEPPYLVPGDHTPLEPGMVLALETGVYYPGRFGLRIESMFVVTPGGGVPVLGSS